MFKKQLKFEKFVCLLSIISSAVVFVYSLGIMTDLYECLYSTMRDPRNLEKTDVAGSIVYYNMQGFNSLLLSAGIALILISCLLFLTNTHIRRKYYIGNYFATLLTVVANVGVAVWAHGQIEYYKAQWLQVDFAALLEHSQKWSSAYTESTFWFDAHYAVFALTIIACVLLLVNMFWKISLMSAETKLIKAGKGEAA